MNSDESSRASTPGVPHPRPVNRRLSSPRLASRRKSSEPTSTPFLFASLRFFPSLGFFFFCSRPSSALSPRIRGYVLSFLFFPLALSFSFILDFTRWLGRLFRLDKGLYSLNAPPVRKPSLFACTMRPFVDYSVFFRVLKQRLFRFRRDQATLFIRRCVRPSVGPALQQTVPATNS